jgi:hypothetical protein
MKIQLEIPADRIVSLMCSAIEGGDPVTTARKGGWCWGIYWKSMKGNQPDGYWYADQTFLGGKFRLQILEVADENLYDRDTDEAGNIKSGAFKLHTVTDKSFVKGFAVMAQKFPHQFGHVMTNDIDAPCADAFLQSMLFGEEKYA